MQILYIEDDPVDRMAFERMMEQEKTPFPYSVAESVHEGLEYIETGRFDLILVDLRLPDGTAIDVLNHLELGEKKIVVLTAIDSVETAVLAMKRGACDYIIKDMERAYLTYLPDVIRSFETELKAPGSGNPDIITYLQDFLDISPFGGLVTEIHTGRVVCVNERFFTLWGIPPEIRHIPMGLTITRLQELLASKLLFEQDRIFLNQDYRKIIDAHIPLTNGRTIQMFSHILPSDQDEIPMRITMYCEDQGDDRINRQPADKLNQAALVGEIAHELHDLLSHILLNISETDSPSLSDSPGSPLRKTQAKEAALRGRDLANRLLDLYHEG